jgi:hypothetical protein
MSRCRITISFLATASVTLLLATCAPVDSPSDRGTSPTGPSPISTQAVTPSVPKPDKVKDRIEAAIEQCRKRELLTTNGFWTVFHGILGMGPSLTLTNPDTGFKVNAVDYISDGGEIRGLKFLPTQWGLDVQTGPPFVGQGHQDQYVAEMGQWNMAIDRKFMVNSKAYKFADFVNHSKMRAKTTAKNPPQELSWAIIVIAQYVGVDAAWTNEDGEKLTLADCVHYEIHQPIEGAACGGTHRLFGLRWVHNLHLQKGGKTEGIWKELDEQQTKYQQLARKWQNPDGSFSTDFFVSQQQVPDMQRRMNTSGHILEWLALSLSDEQLKEPWVEDAANAVAVMFLDIQGQPMEGGTLYHAAHGLLIYYARRYDPKWLGANMPLVMLPDRALGAK